jgi:molybdopterin-guanine dinucleotide biosynthesis protein A
VADRDLTGILLVGGASTRFGSAKALARLGGDTLAARAWRVLGDVCQERIAVGKVADGLELPFPLLDDDADVRAPLAGLVAGLRAARHELCVVLPVDCPLVDANLLRELVARCHGDAAVPQTGPLPGAYRRSALAVLERRLAAGELALRGAAAELDATVVELDPGALANVNTPADLGAVARRLAGEGQPPHAGDRPAAERERHDRHREADEDQASLHELDATPQPRTGHRPRD